MLDLLEAKRQKAEYDTWYKSQPEVKQRIKDKARAYYFANKVEKNKKAKLRYQEKKEERIQQGRLYYQKNKEKKLAKNAEWKQKNRHKVTSYAANRRAKQKQATPKWANKELILEFYKTANGLSMHTGVWYHVDHIVPLTSDLVCGLHVQDNLQVLLAPDNLQKHNKLLDLP